MVKHNFLLRLQIIQFMNFQQMYLATILYFLLNLKYEYYKR